VKKSFRLPSYVGTRNTDQLFEFCTAVQNHPGELEIDARDVKFLDPLGLAVLAALLSPRCAYQTVSLNWLSVKIAAYLDRMDFFTHCPVQGVYVPHGATRNDLRRTLVEITPVTAAWETDQTANRLATALTGQMTGLNQPKTIDFNDPQSEFDSFNRPIQYALNELLDNSLTHARREGRAGASVWVAAQHYQAEDDVRIAVVDDGCGFLATLVNHPELTVKSHMAAIELALKPFISCNRDAGIFAGSVNEGVGLTITRNISEAAGGGMMIVSGDGRFTTGRGGTTFKSPVCWSGVAISFVCKRSGLPGTNPSMFLPTLPESSTPAPNLRFSD
jgi:two-component sensor histidine kinase